MLSSLLAVRGSGYLVRVMHKQLGTAIRGPGRHLFRRVTVLDSTPADLTMNNGVTHRIWLDDDGTVISVEGETISLEDAQRKVSEIIVENQICEEVDVNPR